jgi:hypothetical protein
MITSKRFVKRFILAVSITGATIFFWSCYYDSKEFLFPEINDGCDTINITFALSVAPVLDQYCLSCHGNSTAASYGSNIKLEDYTDVKAQADNGKLIGSISHESGYSPMPKGASKLDNCIITAIKQWIDAGAQNN